MGLVASTSKSLRGKSTNVRGPLASQDLEGIAEHLKACRRVVVMVGAGMSVSAGLPDFRTPGTGLYDNLQRYNLPYPEAVFDQEYFNHNPRPFYHVCKELWPGQYQPTLAHHFVALLREKGLLRRCYTQNIDSLESAAGLPGDVLVPAHGNFDSATCLGNGRKVPTEDVRKAVMSGYEACEALNKEHGGPVKPDIVFFGESLPTRFFKLFPEDFGSCDLLLVLGTSLKVQPFAGLLREVHPGVPRLLINRERVGEDGGFKGLASLTGSSRVPGFRFDEANMRDVFCRGDCDVVVMELAKHLGWQPELLERLRGGAEATTEGGEEETISI